MTDRLEEMLTLIDAGLTGLPFLKATFGWCLWAYREIHDNRRTILKLKAEIATLTAKEI